MPLPEAPVTEVGEAVAADILAVWAASATPPGAGDGSEYDYVEPFDLDTLTGRRVWTFPASFGNEAASRGEDLWQFAYGVIVAERWTGTGERPPKEWLNERVAFLHLLFSHVGSHKPQRSPGPLLAGTPPRKLWTQRASTPEVFAYQYLSGNHVYWAEMEVEFSEVR